VKVVTYALMCDNRGVRHYVGEDGRSLCGFAHSRETYMGYQLSSHLDYTYPDDCRRCEVHLTRFHGRTPEDHRIPEPF
jgi:hypothetical protein